MGTTEIGSVVPVSPWQPVPCSAASSQHLLEETRQVVPRGGGRSRRQLAPDSPTVRPPNRGQRRDLLTKDGYAGFLREDRVWGSP